MPKGQYRVRKTKLFLPVVSKAMESGFLGLSNSLTEVEIEAGPLLQKSSPKNPPKKKITKKKKKKFLGDFSVTDIISQLPIKRIEFCFAASEVTKPMRRTYGRKLRRDFVERAHNDIFTRYDEKLSKKLLVKHIRGYDVHHKLPISLGGNNNDENLLLIDRSLHEYIHKWIDKKIHSIEGVQRTHRALDVFNIHSLRHDLEILGGVYLEEDGRIMIDIPFPDGRFLIPQLFMYELKRQKKVAAPPTIAHRAQL